MVCSECQQKEHITPIAMSQVCTKYRIYNGACQTIPSAMARLSKCCSNDNGPFDVKHITITNNPSDVSEACQHTASVKDISLETFQFYSNSRQS